MPDVEAIDECVAAGLLTATHDAVAFRHELAREAVASGLSAPRRRELELIVLDGFDRARRGGRRAARPPRPRGAGAASTILRHARDAAAAAAAVAAHREALEHAEAALGRRRRSSGADRVELLELLATEAYLCGRLAQALARPPRGARPARGGRPQRRRRRQPARLSRLHWWAGDGDAAERGRPARDRDPRAARAHRAARHGRTARSPSCTRWPGGTRRRSSSERRRSSSRPSVGDDETRSHALTNVGTSSIQTSGPGTARDLLEQATEIATRRGFHDHAARALANLVLPRRPRARRARRRTGSRACAHVRARAPARRLRALHARRSAPAAASTPAIGSNSEVDAREVLDSVAVTSLSPCPALLVDRADPGAPRRRRGAPPRSSGRPTAARPPVSCGCSRPQHRGEARAHVARAARRCRSTKRATSHELALARGRRSGPSGEWRSGSGASVRSTSCRPAPPQPFRLAVDGRLPGRGGAVGAGRAARTTPPRP